MYIIGQTRTDFHQLLSKFEQVQSRRELMTVDDSWRSNAREFQLSSTLMLIWPGLQNTDFFTCVFCLLNIWGNDGTAPMATAKSRWTRISEYLKIKLNGENCRQYIELKMFSSPIWFLYQANKLQITNQQFSSLFVWFWDDDIIRWQYSVELSFCMANCSLRLQFRQRFSVRLSPFDRCEWVD